MNSSGIKRGLAASAISALAIAGLPLFASSASAAVGDELTVVSVSPVRNGGSAGVFVQATLKGITPGNVKVAKSDLSSLNPDSATQDIGTVVGFTTIANGATGDSNPNDGLPEAVFNIQPITTSQDGGTFNFALFEDEGTAGTVDAGDARAQVTGTTSGAPASLDISPNSQVAAANQDSGNYTLTVKDSAGRVTQLTTGESVTVTDPNNDGNNADGDTDTVVTGGNITSTPRGTATFTARNPSTGGYTLRATSAGTPTVLTTQATLNVVTAANITANEVDVATGADSWPTNPANRNYATDVNVRVDQGSITLEFNAPNDPNATVAFTATSVEAPAITPDPANAANDVTFDNGRASKSYSVVLDAQGKGTVTITPDAASIQNGDVLYVNGSGLDFDFNFVRGAAADLVAPSGAQTATYVSKVGGTVDVVVKVVDQFGLPVTSGLVDVRRFGGVNNEANFSAKKPVGSDGTVTFTLTDTKGTANSTAQDTVEARYFVDQFAAAPTLGPETVGTIRYTTDGTGDPISFTVDNISVDGTGYNASQVTLNPLTLDGNATSQIVGANQANDEFVQIGIVGGTAGVPVTVSADNGGLIIRVPGGGPLPADRDEVADGAASVTGAAGDSYYLIATKTGPINVTVASAGKSKTAAVTSVPVPNAVGGASTARNVTVTGPTEAVSGDLVDFVVKVTDGYGNPVSGVSFGVNIRVSGPARLQDTSSTSNAAGEISVSVRLDDDADSPVTVSAEGLPAAGGFFFQFGDAANTISNAAGGANNAPGMPVSSNVATATITDVTNLQELEQAVADAEQALAEAQDALEAAQGDLDVAQTELAVAQANVDSLKAKKAELRQKLNKAKKNDNKQKAKTTRKKLRAVKRNLRAAQDDVTIASAKVDAAQNVVDNRTQDVADAQADLDEANANLEEAQN